MNTYVSCTPADGTELGPEWDVTMASVANTGAFKLTHSNLDLLNNRRRALSRLRIPRCHLMPDLDDAVVVRGLYVDLFRPREATGESQIVRYGEV